VTLVVVEEEDKALPPHVVEELKVHLGVMWVLVEWWKTIRDLIG
jgi:hypothetical protein